MNFVKTIGVAIEAAATGAVGTAKSLMAYIKQIVTQVGDVTTPDTNVNTSLHELKHKDASHTFSSTTDSNEAIRDQLDLVPASSGAVVWNDTARAAIQTEANDALIANYLDHYQLTPVVNPLDMTAEVADATVLSEIMTRTGDTSDFVPDTDSLEGLSDELAKVPKSDAAVSWNVTALAAIEGEAEDALQAMELDHLSDLTDGVGNFPNTVVDGAVISKIISKVGGGDTSSYDETTDSLEMLSDKLGAYSGDGGAGADDSVKAELDVLHTDIDAILADTGTDGVVVNTFTAGGKAELQVEANDALIANQLDHLESTACGDTTDPVDMSTEVVDHSVLSNLLTDDGDTSTYDRRTDSLQAIRAKIEEVEATIPLEVCAFNTTTTLKADTVVLFSLDALGGAKRNVRIEFYLASDGAATFTPNWYATRVGDPATFISRLTPAVAAIATPAANGRYAYEYGDLPEGGQVEFRIAQDNAGAATVACDAALTYES